jgi:hypothetical protein
MQSDVTHAQMIDPQLRALDLGDCPKLQSIDLRASTQPEIHLSVISCPLLSEIFLPKGARAYLHIEFGLEAPIMQIFGGVAHIDVAWQHGRFEKTTEGDKPWSFAILGSLEDLKSSSSSVYGKGLWVVTKPIQSELIDLVLPESVGSVLLSTPKGLKHCRIYSNCVFSLDIRNATELAHLEIFGSCANISLNACPSLHCIDGPNELGGRTKLALHNGSGASGLLRLNMQFTEVMIADSRISRLAMSKTTSLRLFRCYSLYKLNVPKDCDVECTSFTPPELIGIATTIFDEATLTHELDRIKSGNVDAWPILRALLPLASSDKFVPRVLKGLEAAMNLGVSIDEIWTTRLELYAQHKASQNRKPKQLSEQQLLLGTKEWAWSMASDLSHDGWRADWKIWNRANEAGIKDVRKMFPVMIDGFNKSTQASGALLSQLLNQASPSDIRVLTAVFERLAKDPSQSNEYSLTTARKCAILDPETPELSLLVKSAKDFICNELELKDLIVVLEGWLRADPVDTRVRLVQLGANPPRSGTRGMSIARFKQLTQTLLLGGRLVEAAPIRPAPRPLRRLPPPTF